MSLDYHPGDIVDGQVLGSDNAWHDIAGPPGSAPDGTTAEPPVEHGGGKHTTVIAALVVIAIVSAVAIGLYFLLSAGSEPESQPAPSADGAVPGPAEVPALDVGDCLLGPFGEASADLAPVDCSAAHMGEIVLVEQQFFAADDGLPPMTELDQRARVACETAVAGYTGQPFSTSPYGYWYFAPSEWTWMQGDRGLLCVATTLNDDWTEELQTTGSIAKDADQLAQSAPDGTSGG